MKAVVYTKYGSPGVLNIKELIKPVPKENEVLIKIYSTTVTAADCIFRKGKPFFSRLYTGLTKPKHQTLGCEFAGMIEAVGKDVKSFKEGDQVVGTTPGYGAYTEYLILQPNKSTLTLKPSNLSFEEAAACDGYLTALMFLRDTGKIQTGQKVLINGASGSVGSAAVQLANYFGAEVTGVCSTGNVDLVKSIGANNVIDYTKENFTASGGKYDIIFDAVGKISFSQCKNSLNKNGIFLEAAITLSVFPSVLFTKLWGDNKVKIAATGLKPPAERTKDLYFIKGLIEEGKIKPVMDKTFPFAEIVDAHAYVDNGHKKGNVAIKVQHS